mmetsp:Transcript_46196/g.100380  ORF Transcript_46196/g.100380 Transcript_46196/m.100380 type:complete len:240 (-) Transcript_46196:1109-1828(-)
MLYTHPGLQRRLMLLARLRTRSLRVTPRIYHGEQTLRWRRHRGTCTVLVSDAASVWRTSAGAVSRRTTGAGLAMAGRSMRSFPSRSARLDPAGGVSSLAWPRCGARKSWQAAAAAATRARTSRGSRRPSLARKRRGVPAVRGTPTAAIGAAVFAVRSVVFLVCTQSAGKRSQFALHRCPHPHRCQRQLLRRAPHRPCQRTRSSLMPTSGAQSAGRRPLASLRLFASLAAMYCTTIAQRL